MKLFRNKEITFHALIFLTAGLITLTSNAASRQCEDNGGAIIYLSQPVNGVTAEIIAEDFISQNILPNSDIYVRDFWNKFKSSHEHKIDELVSSWEASQVAKNAVLDRKAFVELLFQLRKTIVELEKERQSPENAAKLIAGEWNDWRADHMKQEEFIEQFVSEARSRQQKNGTPIYGATLQAAQSMRNRLDDLHDAAGSRDPAEDLYQMWLWDSYIRQKAADIEIGKLRSMRDGEAYLNEYLINRKATIKCVVGKFTEKHNQQLTQSETQSIKQSDRFESSLFAEPTEKEMFTAVATKFNQINANYRAIGQKCERREFENDPLLAMQCITICGAGGGKCSISFELTRFEKLACTEAREQAGYVCDFVVGFSSDSPFAKGAMNQLTGGGNSGQGRFIYNNNSWIFLPMNRR